MRGSTSFLFGVIPFLIMKPFLIGLCGLSGAGKSTLARHLESQGGVKRFRFDAFYKDEADCPKVEGITHWDLPESLLLDQVYEALCELKEGHEIFVPIYEKSPFNRRVGRALFHPSPVIFAEGLHLFADPRLRELMDLRLWLDVSEETALARKRERDSWFDVDYYQRFALPAAREHVLPKRVFAHAFINGEGGLREVAAQTDALLQKYLVRGTVSA